MIDYITANEQTIGFFVDENRQITKWTPSAEDIKRVITLTYG